MARRPTTTPDPHLPSRHPTMPDVVAATSLPRRGYSSYSHASMCISFHAGLGPFSPFEDEQFDSREDDAFWGLARRALPHSVSDSTEPTWASSENGGFSHPGRPSVAFGAADGKLL